MSKINGILRRSAPQDDIAKKILEWLLYLFVFLLPWQTRWIIYDPLINGGVWEYGRIAIYGFDVVFIIAILLYCYIVLFCHPERRPSGARPESKDPLNLDNGKATVKGFFVSPKGLPQNDKKAVFVFLFLCFYVFLSILWADYKILFLYWSLRILQGVLLIWILSKIDFSKVKLMWGFVTGVTLSAILGIYQFLTQSAFASKWLGLAYHSAGRLGDSVVETLDGRWLRAYGSFPHPNVLAGFCVLAIILCLWLLSKQKNKLLLIVNCLLLTVGLFFTFSRAAWIVFFIILLLSFFCHPERRPSEARPESKDPLNMNRSKATVKGFFVSPKGLPQNDKGGVFMFFVFLCFCVFCVIYWPLVQTRIQSSARLEVKSNVQRVSSYQESFEIIKNNLWLGTGIGNYTVELQKLKPDLESWDYQPVHNAYLLVLAELGIVGILLIIILLYCYIIASARRLGEQKEIVFMFLCFFAFMFLWDHFWWTLASGMLVVFLSISLINKKSSV